MGRRAHLVGSLPGDSAADAMEAALSRLGPYLLTLSDGETGPRVWWIGAPIHRLQDNPDVEAVRGQAEYSDYDTVLQFELRDGATLTVANLEACLPYEAAFRESYPVFRDLRVKHGRPDLPFQVGIPCHLDLSVDAFGFQLGFAPQYYQPSLAATVSQVNKIAAGGTEDLVFQIETPAALISVAGADAGAAQEEMARQVATLVAELPAAAPAGARFGVHLCLGDLEHKSLGRMTDITPAVLVANELAKAWPAGRSLEFMHVPFAAAEEPPTFDRAFYEPLAGLDIPESVRFIAGCIHESLGHDEQVDLLRLIETHVGREVDVAAACGLGRRPDVSQVWDAMEKALLLVEQPA